MSYVVVDTESSGLPDYKKPADAPGQPRVAAIAMIFVDKDLVVEETHSGLIRPDGWIFDDNSDAAKINGLTHRRLMEDGWPIKDLLRLYGEAIDSRRIVAGFNISHDLKMLRAEMRYVGYPDRFMQTRHLCVMQGCRKIVDARTADGRKKAPRLEEACAHFQIERDVAHTALSDASDALAILRRLRDLGEMPAYTDPYDREPKKKSPAPRERPQGRAYEEAVMQQQEDFLRGASEDGK